MAEVLVFIAAVIVVVCIYALDWGATVGILYLIYQCFGWEWSWSVATVIWIVILLVKTIIKGCTNKE